MRASERGVRGVACTDQCLLDLRQDLICLPKSLAKSLGQLPQLVLCSRITNSIRLMDPVTLNYADIPAEK